MTSKMFFTLPGCSAPTATASPGCVIDEAANAPTKAPTTMESVHTEGSTLACPGHTREEPTETGRAGLKHRLILAASARKELRPQYREGSTAWRCTPVSTRGASAPGGGGAGAGLVACVTKLPGALVCPGLDQRVLAAGRGIGQAGGRLHDQPDAEGDGPQEVDRDDEVERQEDPVQPREMASRMATGPMPAIGSAG
jgi:hypothetical protein